MLARSSKACLLLGFIISFLLTSLLDVLKLSSETDLDILNHVMESMVKHYTNELLPVAAELTARLVGLFIFLYDQTC